eukprot:SAG22_NODE_14047_length_386_cov_1.135889_1_plen_20_part_01
MDHCMTFTRTETEIPGPTPD